MHDHTPVGVEARPRRSSIDPKPGASPLLSGLQRWEPISPTPRHRLLAPDTRPGLGDVSHATIATRLREAWFFRRDDRAREMVARMNRADGTALTLPAENALIAELLGFWQSDADLAAIVSLYTTHTLDQTFEQLRRASAPGCPGTDR